jgi:Bacterial Ig-like domain (group 3)
LTVIQATTAVSVSTSMNPSVLQNPITITAMVNAQATGSVSFMNGTTPLGSGAVSGGVATLITSSLPAGSQSIVAVYGGDANFVTATSAASSQMVLDFGVNPGSASGSGSSGSGMAQTVAPGKTATYMLAITPTAGTQLPLATVLSVSGLPSGATASLSNAAWTQLSSTSWSLPSNTPIGSVALTFQVPSETASAAKKDAPMHPLSPVFLGVLFLPFATAMRRRGRPGTEHLVVAAIGGRHCGHYRPDGLWNFGRLLRPGASDLQRDRLRRARSRTPPTSRSQSNKTKRVYLFP